MAQFIPYDENVEVSSESTRSIIDSLDSGKSTRAAMMAKHGITEIKDGEWYKQKNLLACLQDISVELGDNTLFTIGKAIPDVATFPKEVDNLEKALSIIDVAYQMNHRGGKIGHYALRKFDQKNQKAVIICDNPYPSEFDRGIITTMLRRFKPKTSYKYDVVLDTTKETRLNGAHSCTYMVSW